MMDKTTGGPNIMYNILEAMGKDAEFLYDSINKYTEDALKTNDQELVNTWNGIKADRLNHLNELEDALEKELRS
jgi:hypothetical protein